MHPTKKIGADWEALLSAERHLQQLDGVLTGIRQLRRQAALETESIAGLCVPTLAKMTRIKAWLLVTRYTVRDYLDTVVLLERLGDAAVTDDEAAAL